MDVCVFGNPRLVHVQRLAAGLVERGVVVHVVTHTPSALPGVTVEPYRVPRPGWRNLRRWQARETHYLRSFFRRFDVVNVQFLHDWGLTRSPEIMEEGCFVASPWGSDIVPPPGESAPTDALRAARIAMLRRADAVTAWGPTFAGMIADYAGIDVSRIPLLPLGVDPTLFDPDIPPTPEESNGPRIGYFKGFREVYGPTVLMEAIPLILKKFPTAHFDLIGDGPQLKTCHKMARESNVASSITWYDHQPHEAVPGYIRPWDVTVISSVRESFGAAALESSAMRVPVVASNVGGLPETVRDGLTGLLVPPHDPMALASGVVKLLRDDALRLRMGHAGRNMVVREYDWRGVLDDWVRVLAEARDHATCMV